MNLKKINGIRNKVINAINKIDEEERKLIQKYTSKIEDEFNLICDSEITKFYSSYSTHPKYDRTGDLYNTYKIKTNKYSGEFVVKFDSMYMKYYHRIDHDYIFENSFIQGYHGGAINGNNPLFPHPNPGTPYWKNPLTNYRTWLRPAEKSDSPYENIIKELKIKEDEIQKDLEEDFEKTMLNILNPIKAEINKLLQGG